MPRSSATSVQAVVDSLHLPLPPTELVFSLSANSKPTACASGQVQRYGRSGSGIDARKAVVGKGGFGTVYRFERDDSFTPPQSIEHTGHSDRRASVTVEDPMPSVVASPEMMMSSLPDAHSTLTRDNPNSALQSNWQTGRAETSGSHLEGRLSGHQERRSSRGSGPAVIIVKVCRTPTSGSFDEMPKTGEARNVAKAADAAMLKGDTTGFHTRIVRGEARLFRFLQMMARREGRSSSQSGLVRMLADLPLGINAADGTTFVDDSETALATEEASGPVPRLLVFERLVDLDAVLTPKGWVKRKRQWTYTEIEDTAREMAAGLSFLHANHIVHGDLKPSNVMRDAKTGVAKLIDLGASRRFVCVPNLYKDSTTAVEELDQFLSEGSVPPQSSSMVFTEGLGSLTGSPYFMAPEVLLQAGRYLDHQNLSRSVLHDYVNCRHLLPIGIEQSLFEQAFDDFVRGWGVKSDIWSWACSVLALLLRLLPPEKARSSSTVCPFDFSFDDMRGSLEPRHKLHRSERNLPRFHEWARRFPIRIAGTLVTGVLLPPEIDGLSSAAIEMVQMSLTHMDQRPSAASIYRVLSSVKTPAEVAAQLQKTDRSEHRKSLTPSLSASEAEGHVSHANSVHNVDLRASPGPGASYTASVHTPRPSYSNCSALQPMGYNFARDGSETSSLHQSDTASISEGHGNHEQASSLAMSMSMSMQAGLTAPGGMTGSSAGPTSPMPSPFPNTVALPGRPVPLNPQAPELNIGTASNLSVVDEEETTSNISMPNSPPLSRLRSATVTLKSLAEESATAAASIPEGTDVQGTAESKASPVSEHAKSEQPMTTATGHGPEVTISPMAIQQREIGLAISLGMPDCASSSTRSSDGSRWGPSVITEDQQALGSNHAGQQHQQRLFPKARAKLRSMMTLSRKTSLVNLAADVEMETNEHNHDTGAASSGSSKKGTNKRQSHAPLSALFPAPPSSPSRTRGDDTFTPTGTLPSPKRIEADRSFMTLRSPRSKSSFNKPQEVPSPASSKAASLRRKTEGSPNPSIGKASPTFPVAAVLNQHTGELPSPLPEEGVGTSEMPSSPSAGSPRLHSGSMGEAHGVSRPTGTGKAMAETKGRTIGRRSSRILKNLLGHGVPSHTDMPGSSLPALPLPPTSSDSPAKAVMANSETQTHPLTSTSTVGVTSQVLTPLDAPGSLERSEAMVLTTSPAVPTIVEGEERPERDTPSDQDVAMGGSTDENRTDAHAAEPTESYEPVERLEVADSSAAMIIDSPSLVGLEEGQDDGMSPEHSKDMSQPDSPPGRG